jgi:O-antigen/teichoic acid export membrane protein
MISRSGDSRSRLVDAVANLVGRGASVLVSLALIPVYLSYVGIEAYGLISLSVAIQAVFSLVDLGFSAVILRETAKVSDEAAFDKGRLANLLRTFEFLFAALALLLFVFSITVLPTLGARWVTSSSIDPGTMRLAFLLVGCFITVKFMTLPYAGLLAGLQRQLLGNAISVSYVCLRGGGAVAIFAMGYSTIVAYYVWLLVATMIELSVFALLCWRLLGGRVWNARPEWALVLSNWRFARGVLSISASAAIFSQVDKMLLSRMLSLDQLGAYSVAAQLAVGLYNLVYPFATAASPRLTQLSHNNDHAAASELYLLYGQFGALLTFPIGLVVIFFAEDIAYFYLRNPTVTAQVAPLLRITMIGALFGSLVPLPHALQLAKARTALIVGCNWLAIALILPGMWLVTGAYGAVGAAWIWALVNILYVAIFLLAIEHGSGYRTLRGWADNVLLRPLLASLVFIVLGEQVASHLFHDRLVVVLATLSVSYVATFCLCGLARRNIVDVMRTLRTG